MDGALVKGLPPHTLHLQTFLLPSPSLFGSGVCLVCMHQGAGAGGETPWQHPANSLTVSPLNAPALEGSEKAPPQFSA